MLDKKIKMIALDLDGTTLNAYGELTPRTIEAFHHAMKNNVHIVICTGRTFESLPEQLFSIEGLEYIVTSNGARITRLADLKTVYENNIDAVSVDQIIELLEPLGYSLEIFIQGKAYIAKEEYETYIKEGSSYRDVQYVLRTRNPIEDFFNFMRMHRDEIENINISFPKMQDRQRLMSLLGSVENVTLTTSFIHNIEIGGATTSKADALCYLMEKLVLSREELLAAGDSLNDLAMIQLAEIGVVMGNASEEMKQYADEIADDHTCDGVAKIIEKYI